MRWGDQGRPRPQPVGGHSPVQQYGRDKPLQNPGAPVPPGVPPTPPMDPYLASLQAQNGLNLNLSNANAAYNTGQVGYQTGYNAAGGRDYSNPYSQAALLEEHFKRSQLGTENSYAGQGQLYSGAYGRMQNENARNYSIGSNTLQNQAGNAYHGIDVGQAQNAITYGTGTVSPELAALLRALGVTK